jgi:hypothetical protein
MADFQQRTRHTARTEYVLPNPTTWVEIEKVLVALREDLSGEPVYDDTVTVSANDTEIVFSYPLTDALTKGA